MYSKPASSRLLISWFRCYFNVRFAFSKSPTIFFREFMSVS